MKCTSFLPIPLTELNITQVILKVFLSILKCISYHHQWTIDVKMYQQINFRAYLGLRTSNIDSIWTCAAWREKATVANMCKLYSIDRFGLVNTCRCAAAMSMTCPISRYITRHVPARLCVTMPVLCMLYMCVSAHTHSRCVHIFLLFPPSFFHTQ